MSENKKSKFPMRSEAPKWPPSRELNKDLIWWPNPETGPYVMTKKQKEDLEKAVMEASGEYEPE